jgi:hypothetical protein
MSEQTKKRRRAAGYRGMMRIAGPVVTVVGIGLVAISAFDYSSSVGTEQTSKLNIMGRRTLRSPTYGWFRWLGTAFIAGGVVMTTIGFEIFTGRKDEPETETPKRKSIGEPLGGAKKPKR